MVVRASTKLMFLAPVKQDLSLRVLDDKEVGDHAPILSHLTFFRIDSHGQVFFENEFKAGMANYMCFTGVSGTIRYVVDAVPNRLAVDSPFVAEYGDGVPACSSTVQSVTWRSQIAFISLHGMDPRIGDKLSDFRDSPLDAIDGTHVLDSQSDIETATKLLWAPLERAVAANDCSSAGICTGTPPDFWTSSDMADFVSKLGFTIDFYDDEHSHVVPYAVDELEVKVLQLPPYMLAYEGLQAKIPIKDTTVHVSLGSRSSPTGIRTIVYEWGCVQIRTLQFGNDYRHFFAVIARRGFPGEFGFTIAGYGATSPVIRYSVKNPIGSIEIVQEAAVGEQGGFKGVPIGFGIGETAPKVRLKDTSGTPLAGYQVMASLVPAPQIGDATEAAFEFNTEDDAESLARPMSAGQFDLGLLQTETLAPADAAGTACSTTYDWHDGVESTGSECYPSLCSDDTNADHGVWDTWASVVGAASEGDAHLQLSVPEHDSDSCHAAGHTWITSKNISVAKGLVGCSLREDCMAVSAANGKGTCTRLFPETRGMKQSCRSGPDGVAEFQFLIPFSVEANTCYQPRYFAVPFRPFEVQGHRDKNANIGSNAYSALGAKMCFSNLDTVSIVEQPSATLTEGRAGFSAHPIIRVSRPYAADILMPKEVVDPVDQTLRYGGNGITVTVTIPAAVKNSAKEFSIPPRAIAKYTKKKLADSVCILFGTETGIKSEFESSCSYKEAFDSAVLDERDFTIFSDQAQVMPKLRHAAPGEEINLQFCSAEALYPGTGVFSATAHICVAAFHPSYHSVCLTPCVTLVRHSDRVW
jgi:hypothetical protein